MGGLEQGLRGLVVVDKSKRRRWIEIENFYPFLSVIFNCYFALSAFFSGLSCCSSVWWQAILQCIDSIRKLDWDGTNNEIFLEEASKKNSTEKI